MAAITTRSTAGTGATVKNSTLTNAEVDNNFINLNVDIQTRLLKTGDTNLYIGSQANSTRFPNSTTVFSSVASGIQKNESHNIGLASENTGSFLAKTIVTGSSGGTTITLSDVIGMYIGQVVFATGVATDAIITNINTGTNVITLSIANIGTPSGTAYIMAYGVGVYGVGYTYGVSKGIGIIGEAHVNTTGSTAKAIGVKGYSSDTHAGGSNIGLYCSAENGLTNYSLYLNKGDIYSESTVNKTWYLNSNLTFSSVSGSYSITIPQLLLGTDLAVSQGGTGGSSFTTNGVLLGNGTNTFQTVSPGSSGNILTSNGTTWTSSALSSLLVTTALGYTPYNASNPSGYISGITSGNISTALGYTPYNASNPSGYISGITSGTVTTALGYTPIQQGGGTSQTGNKIYIGWSSGSLLRVQVDSTDFGTNWPIGISGNATTATSATSASTFTSTTQNSRFNSIGVGTAASGVAGEIRASGNIVGYVSSDKKYKNNIREIDNALEKVISIGSKYFDWTDEYINERGGEDNYFLQKSDFGIIAQDVQTVFPEAVKQREDGSLAVDYTKLGILSFGAIKELQQQINELRELISNK